MTSTTEEKRTTGTHDEVEGKVHELKGKIKQKIGGATNNPDLQDEGTNERINGTVEKTVGKVKKAFGA
jgi:uncharacterized protein YjbJ (UPF0337 family)